MTRNESRERFADGADPPRTRENVTVNDLARLGVAGLAASALLAAGCATVPGADTPLDVAVAQRVAPGQSRDEVRAVLGPPVTSTSFATLGEEVWAYKVVDASQAKPRRNFYVYFDDRTGAVRRTEALSDGDYDTGCGTGR